MNNQQLPPWGRLLRKPWPYLPFLLGPIMIGLVYVLAGSLRADTPEQTAANLDPLVSGMEWIAPWLLLAVTAVYFGKGIALRNLTYLVLGTIAACLLLRELHWSPTIKDAIYPLLGICFVWMFLWRDILDPARGNWRHTVFFVAALATYGLAQFTEKRLIKFLPDEDMLHSQMEEFVEVSAHGLLLLAALAGDWSRRKLTVDKPAAKHEDIGRETQRPAATDGTYVSESREDARAETSA
jgi:hypothetical protein